MEIIRRRGRGRNSVITKEPEGQNECDVCNEGTRNKSLARAWKTIEVAQMGTASWIQRIIRTDGTVGSNSKKRTRLKFPSNPTVPSFCATTSAHTSREWPCKNYSNRVSKFYLIHHVLPSPSWDFSSNDIHFFRPVDNFLEEKPSRQTVDIENTFYERIDSSDSDTHEFGSSTLALRWQKCIERTLDNFMVFILS